MNFITSIVDKVKSRKLAVTAVAGAAAASGAVELTWPMAAVAIAYVMAQAIQDPWGREATRRAGLRLTRKPGRSSNAFSTLVIRIQLSNRA